MAEARDIGEPLEAGDEAEGPVAVAGRLVARRGQGKTVFADIEDRSGTIQAWATLDRLGEQGLGVLADAHVGDIIGVRGTVVRTRRGEVSVAADAVEMLAKSLRPPPDRHAGLKDPETRYRQRYLDLMASDEVRAQFVIRARAIAGVRRFLDDRGFIEVETPVLQPIYGGAAARPFVTHHNELDRDLYLRIATELYLKRCLVGGLEKVYEIGKDFRNEGVSPKHNPEFTMLEWYEAYADYEKTAADLEHLVAGVAEAVLGTTVVERDGESIDLAPPWERVTLRDAIFEVTGIDIEKERSLEGLAGAIGVEPEAGIGWGKLVDDLFSKRVEPTFVRPTFVIDYPVELSPFAKDHRSKEGVVERWEAFVAGMEIANSFTELNDPDEQRRRFEQQAAELAGGDEEAQPYDESFVEALEQGMPPTGGVGLGIDRLVMVLSGAPSVREVVLFPAMRD